MFFRALSAVLAAIIIPAAAAHAQQFEATGGVFNGTDYGASYSGAGGTTPLYNQALGQVVDGGNGAFDAFGFYNSGVGSLTQTRQVDLLSGNVFRFFDTFTNNSAATVTTTLNFFGNLGSDGDELVSAPKAGLLVSCENDGSGNCGSDPVLALVFGNNGLGQASITPDRYNASFLVSVKAGESLSLLNFAFLASEMAGPASSDLLLAGATGEALLSAPRLEGLSMQQIGTVANFTATIPAPVPEPSAFAMMALGLGVVGASWRRRVRR